MPRDGERAAGFGRLRSQSAVAANALTHKAGAYCHAAGQHAAQIMLLAALLLRADRASRAAAAGHSPVPPLHSLTLTEENS